MASAIAALEAYVLAPDAQARAAVLKSLVEGSEAWYELELAERFRAGRAADEDTKGVLMRYRSNFPGQAEQWLVRAELLRCCDLPPRSQGLCKALGELARSTLGLNLNHAMPAATRGSGAGAAGTDAEADAMPSVLPAVAVPSRASALEELYNGASGFIERLPQSCLLDYDFAKLPLDDNECVQFLHRLHRQVPLSMVGGTEGSSKLFARLVRMLDKAPTIPDSVLTLLTAQQLEALAGSVNRLVGDSEFVRALMLRKFPDARDPEAKSLLSREQKRDVLRQLLAFVEKTQGSDPVAVASARGIRVQLMLELLRLGVELNDFDQELILRYCGEAQLPNQGRFQQQQGGYQLPPCHPSAFECSEPFFFDREKVRCDIPLLQQQPVREHLRAFILDQEFEKLVTPLVIAAYPDSGTEQRAKRELMKFRDEVSLLRGVPLSHTNVDAGWVEELSKRASIELVAHNRERFGPEEEVKLNVRVKNVPQLTVRIYEISVENYYLHHQRPFSSDIDLDGVGATIEEEYSYSQAPAVEHDEELNFPQLANKQGLFVIDFVGAGMRSRAVIRKGTLLLIHRTSPIGHVAYVLGPDREVVKQGARLHMGGRWYESDSEKGGRIVIPYGKNEETLKVIISALGMAQFSDFTRHKERYELQTAFCLFRESVVMGKLATVVVRPRLLVCGRLCNASLITNAEVTISMRSGTDAVPTVRTFSGFDWTAGDGKVEFLVPPRLRSIEAKLRVEVAGRSKSAGGDVEPLTSERVWTVQNHDDANLWFELYLARNAGGYEIQCLGKDGEPQCGVPMNVMIDTPLSLEAIQTTLVTDAVGAVSLGDLKDVYGILASTGGVARRWELPRQRGVQYPPELDVIEGEELELPSFVDKAYLFELAPSGEPIKTLDDKIRIEGSMLKVSGLPRGRYRIQLLDEAPINLRVHCGKYWQDGYVLRHDAILESRDRPNVVAFARAEATVDSVSAQLSGASPSTRVHILGFRFLPHNLLEVVDALRAVAQEQFSTTTFPFQMWQNILQSNVGLGDELSYVLRRRKADKQVGNLLKKPSLLLQPHAVRDTNFSTEVLSGAGVFAQQAERAMDMPMMMQQAMPRMMPQMQQPMLQACCQANCMRSCDARPCRARAATNYSRRCDVGEAHCDPIFDIQGFQNFLKADAFVALNLRPGADGALACAAPAIGELACVLLVATDERTVAHAVTPIQRAQAAPRAPPMSRALTLAAPLESGSFFVEKRAAKALRSGESFLITDQASAEWRAVDSVERLLAFYRAVKPGLMTPLEEWGFSVWHTLSRAEKERRWSEHLCHEFNLFLFKKDEEFFNEAVRPFLQSKMETDVVDLFLLGRSDRLQPFLAPARFHQLNPLERVLVLYALAPAHAEACSALAGALRSQAAARAKAAGAAARRNVLLDSVLSLEEPKPTSEWTMAGVSAEMAEENPWSPMMAAPAAAHVMMMPQQQQMQQQQQPQQQQRQQQLPQPMQCQMPSGACCFGGRVVGSPPGSMFDMQANEVCQVMAARQPEPWSAPEGTREYAERTYHKCSRGAGAPDFGLSDFWSDVAEHATAPEPRGKLLSPNFVFATASVHEVAAAAALLDLPIVPEQHALVSGTGAAGAGSGLEASFDAASPCVFVAKEIARVPMPQAGSDLSVAVRVYKAKLDETASQDPFAIKEFLALEPYCLQVIVTNVSPGQLEVQALVQIPQGAMPLKRASYTQAHTHRIGAFACWRLIVPFYFPRPGDYTGAPVYCSVDGASVAMSAPVPYHVVRTLSSSEVETFADVVAAGDDAVLRFLGSADLYGEEKGFTFDQLYPLLRRGEFFTPAVSSLRGRGIFDRAAWGYGFLHGDLQACTELLAVEESLHRRLGACFSCPMVTVTPDSANFAHLEYFPLLNKRAHRLGELSGPAPILNRELKGTWERLLRTIARKTGAVDAADRLQLSYFLLCQDRVPEAAAMFKLARDAAVDDAQFQLQRDYMAAYLELFDTEGDLSVVRSVVGKHSKCPNAAWRERFTDLANFLKEVDAVATAGDAGVNADDIVFVGVGDAPPSAGEKASAALSMELRKGTLELQAEGIEVLTVKLYKVDLEMLFSRKPFIQPQTLQSEFSFVKPVFEQPIPGSTLRWDIPAEHRSSDLAVEVVGGSTRTFRMHFASSLRVAVAEKQGCVTVSAPTGRPLPAVYVKVFARVAGGSVSFFKDGYTDLRGRFDYASLSGQNASRVQRFSMLIATGSGGLVLEAAPPAGAQ